MTPKEKAKELVDKFWYVEPEESCDGMEYQMAQQCALIAVDEMLDFMFLSENENSFWINYYNKVKQEIQNL